MKSWRDLCGTDIFYVDRVRDFLRVWNGYLLRRHLPLLPPEKEHKWFTFTYTGKETRHITNLFKHANLRIAFRTNTLHNHLTRNAHTRDKFTCSGVYRLTCPDCVKAYIGQTGRDFASRYNERKRSFQHNTHMSKFAEFANCQNLLNTWTTTHTPLAPSRTSWTSYSFTEKVHTSTP